MFKDRRFDPVNPGANTAVGQGYHQFVWSTFVSKRFRWFEPYFGAWYNLPVRTNGSPFQKYSPAQTSVNPQQRAGVMIGVEQIAWENPRGDQRVTIEARAFVEEHFYGRERSEIWEPLAGPSTCTTNTPTDCRPGIDLEYAKTARTPLLHAPHPGITDIDSYATLGGDIGLNVQVGKYIRFRGLFGFRSDLPHFITADGAGVDAGTKDGRVNPMDPDEANPTYRQAIDLPGPTLSRRGDQDLEPVPAGLDDVLGRGQSRNSSSTARSIDSSIWSRVIQIVGTSSSVTRSIFGVSGKARPADRRTTGPLRGR